MEKSLRRGLTGDRLLVDAGKGIAFYPLFDRILVKPKQTEEKKGLLYIPETARIEETMGEVVAVGYGCFDERGFFHEREPIFDVGDIVVFKEFTGTRITLDIEGEETKYLIMWDRDVLGVLRKATEDAD